MPAKQLHWQKGEQSSCWGWSFFCGVLVSSLFILPSPANAAASAQGMMLNANTRKAIIDANILTGDKGKGNGLLMGNQKLSRCCRSKKPEDLEGC